MQSENVGKSCDVDEIGSGCDEVKVDVSCGVVSDNGDGDVLVN